MFLLSYRGTFAYVGNPNIEVEKNIRQQAKSHYIEESHYLEVYI